MWCLKRIIIAYHAAGDLVLTLFQLLQLRPIWMRSSIQKYCTMHIFSRNSSMNVEIELWTDCPYLLCLVYCDTEMNCLLLFYFVFIQWLQTARHDQNVRSSTERFPVVPPADKISFFKVLWVPKFGCIIKSRTLVHCSVCKDNNTDQLYPSLLSIFKVYYIRR